MKKILLIEDNLEMRENTAEILELANYNVETAENGRIGIQQAKSFLPDLIICDIMMPEIDGYGVLYYLMKIPETSVIPFIFLSAKSELTDIRKGMNLGADDYLTKPFEELELLNAVESRLKRSATFKNSHGNTFDGLSQFMNDAKGLKELKNLSEDKKIRPYKKKEIIYYEDDYPSGIFYIKSGRVKTTMMNNDTKEIITDLFKEGDFFGFMSILQDTNQTETATALEETEIYKIPKEDFLSLIYKNNDVAQNFIKMLSNNLIQKEKQLLNLAYNTVRKRVSEGLVRLAEHYNDSNSNSVVITISRFDLASIVGTATETVIRTLSEFKEEKLVEVKGSKIKILDIDKLRNLKY